MSRPVSKMFASKKLAVCGALAAASAIAALTGACSSSSNNGFSGGTGTTDAGGTGSSSGGTTVAANPCTTKITCSKPTLDVSFTPMYSAYVTDNSELSFQIPAIVKGAASGSTVTWGVSDPTAVACQIDATTGGVMITVQKASNVTVVAQAGDACGESVLNVTSAVNSQWLAGSARYNSKVPVWGGCIGLNKNYPDGGPSACPAQGPACVNCHGKSPKNPFFNGVLHTPQQAGGFSDQQLIDIFTHGVVPDGGYFDTSVVSQLSFSVFHRWSDIQGSDQEAMVVYLRSLPPLTQGDSDFGGSGDGGTATTVDAGPVESTSATCGSTTCTAGEVCCVQPSDKTDAGLVGTCGSASSCTGFALSCSYTGDCPTGQVCCGNFAATPATATCQTSCPAGDDQLCEKVAECPSGDACRQYAFGDGIKACLEKLADGGKAGKNDSGTTDDSDAGTTSNADGG